LGQSERYSPYSLFPTSGAKHRRERERMPETNGNQGDGSTTPYSPLPRERSSLPVHPLGSGRPVNAASWLDRQGGRPAFPRCTTGSRRWAARRREREPPLKGEAGSVGKDPASERCQESGDQPAARDLYACATASEPKRAIELL